MNNFPNTIFTEKVLSFKYSLCQSVLLAVKEMSGRRRAKPNRGGGRFNKSGGGRGGGGRKAFSALDDDDDFNLDLGPGRSIKPPSKGRGRGTFTSRGHGDSRGRGRGSSREGSRQSEERRDQGRFDQFKLPLQKIHMTSENRLQVKELLKELQSQEYTTPDRLVAVWTCICQLLIANLMVIMVKSLV